jgi:hypothetical protein
MPSHLTRVVFRSIIANEPLLYPGCRYQTLRRPRTITQHGARPLPPAQRRTFLDLFKQRRKLKPAEVPAGLEKMGEVLFAKNNALRPPKPAEVAQAIKDFFAQRKGAFEGYHVASAYHSLQYLQESAREDGQDWFSRHDLDKIISKLLSRDKRPGIVGKAHVLFGQAILEEMIKLEQKEHGEGHKNVKPVEVPHEVVMRNKEIQLLSSFGDATSARDMAADMFRYNPDTTKAIRVIALATWYTVLQGIIREDKLDEVSRTMDLLRDLSIPFTVHMQRRIVEYYAGRKDLEKAKFWYSQPVMDQFGEESAQPYGVTSAVLLKACALQGDLTFGQQVIASMLKTETLSKESWDATFLWSAAIGKGADEIDRMMDVLVRRNDQARLKNTKIHVIRPDIETINALVELCISKQDPYSAERFIALGEKRGITPDETTYTMQMQYRISVGDLDGARAAYFNLQGSFSGAERSVAVINQLIQALCVSKQHHFDELMAMVDDLHERKASFDPETVAALTLLHLRRGEIHDAMDLLQVHAHQYAPAQRTIIQHALSIFILDGETSTSDAWDGYQILRNVFVETPREDRIPIMKEFFARKRSDMACHVFFHMRNHISPTHSANRDVYIAAFTGFARCGDAESLELAHNQLKLDLNVDMDTKLRNSLMLAYAATGENRKALFFWREICESKEGPSYNSIAIAFRSCEGMHLGSEHAKSIWMRLKEQDVEIDKTIWTAYMSAIARNHNHDEAKALIETVEEEYGFSLDLHM